MFEFGFLKGSFKGQLELGSFSAYLDLIRALIQLRIVQKYLFLILVLIKVVLE